jgi:hypothetical protein
MPNPQKPPSRDVAILSGQNNLPVVEKFESLVESQGVEAIRIRFRLGRGRLLDLPLSAEALTDLVQPLCALRGVIPAEMPEAIAYLRDQGLIAEE